MSRKVYVELKVRLIIEAEEDVKIGSVISEMDYNFTSNTDNADIIDTDIQEFSVTDSK